MKPRPAETARDAPGYRRLIAALVTERETGEPSGPLDEDAFLAALEREGMTALVALRLDATPLPGLGEPARALLRGRLHNAAAKQMLRQDEISRVLSALADGGVEALLLKGVPLSFWLYPRPWLRPSCDTDLFVHARDRRRTREIFAGLGYQAPAAVTGELVSHQFTMARRDGSGIDHHFDIHWKISNPQAFSNLLTLEEMAASSRAVPELGPNARGPCPVHALLHALIHRVAHFAPADRIIWLYDIHLLGEALGEDEWREFADAAVAKGVALVCLDGLEAAGELFPSPASRPWTATLRRRLDPEREKATTAFLAKEVDPLSVFRSDLAQLGWAGRARLVREHLFPSTAYMRRRYATGSRLLLPWLYLRRIGGGLMKNLKRRSG